MTTSSTRDQPDLTPAAMPLVAALLLWSGEPSDRALAGWGHAKPKLFSDRILAMALGGTGYCSAHDVVGDQPVTRQTADILHGYPRT